MREIKFRLWDEAQDIMYQPEQFDFLIHTDGRLNSHEFGTINGAMHTPQLLKLQYTGLKDKNGVEIYEGDILSIECDFEDYKDTFSKEVKYHLGCFTTEDWRLFELEENKIKGTQKFEVIGNIHENPEIQLI